MITTGCPHCQSYDLEIDDVEGWNCRTCGANLLPMDLIQVTVKEAPPPVETTE